MSEFKIGDEVVILDGTGLVGVIGAKEYRAGKKEFYAVELNGFFGRWYSGDEIAPATAQAAGEGVPSAFAQAAQGDDTLAVALYEAAVLNTMVSELQAELDSARRQLAACQGALNAIFTVTQAALVDQWGVHENNMPADKQVLFRVFRIVDNERVKWSHPKAASQTAEGGS